ncbi:unnamed protein product [Didymodactylos carnosus]|uniref:Reverse transcriptase domain-containing protein n=1 Tax=Didymodactylos carnosus TaxID=1234261 RepID=A0A815A661_9BILA|nr:unnamed protein product [Didymodactylos carnosus]CAF1253182.1 unnamed protein product [Didymodactylos carnosus]CAF3795344.1 unnamed protein product [Didymodactylos carnosus]CAF4023930.1 unnamed protein product [Didymodactylos carnosus]
MTTVDGITWSERIVDRGVPQGSILGPLLFLIFIDDLSDNVSATMRLFADDVSLYRVTEKNNIRKVTDQVNKDLLLIYEWSVTWKLYLNVDKCKAMIFSTRERDTLASLPPVLINKSPISYVVKQKQLGLILRSNLDWTAHVGYVLTKIASYLDPSTFKDLSEEDVGEAEAFIMHEAKIKQDASKQLSLTAATTTSISPLSSSCITPTQKEKHTGMDMLN